MILTVVSLVVALLAALVVHEYAHYRAMRSDNIRVVEAGLGLPFWPTLRVPYRGVTWTLSPWLLGAYVKPHPDDYKRMETSTSYRNLAWHYGAGVWSNFTFAFAAFAVAALIDGRLLRAGIYAVIAVLLWVFRRGFTAYVQPALAPVALAILCYGFYSSWTAGETGLGFAGLAPVGATTFTAVEIISVIAVISGALGIINLLPFFPMDNGRVVAHLLNHWWGERVASGFKLGGTLLVLASLIGSVASDLWAAIF
jgi:membrane-associated protease RseP (regulator of RpoE activity)